MNLSDLSIRRPIICVVASILIMLVGLLRFGLLPVREYPNVDSPTVSVQTTYPGASAEVVETNLVGRHRGGREELALEDELAARRFRRGGGR